METDIEIRPCLPDDRVAAQRLRFEAFVPGHREPDPDEGYLADDRRLVAVRAGRVVGHLAVWDHGQWFGGQRVPTGGVAGVAVTPELRGRGLAGALLTAAVEQMRERGEVLATLYPATVQLYRRHGWELAGTWPRRTVPVAALRDLPRPDRTTVRAADDDDLEAMAACYRGWAPSHSGMLDRSEAFSRRQLRADPGDRRFVAERDGEVVGYLHYATVETDDSKAGYDLDVHDLVAADVDAGRALWRLLGASASMAATARYVGAPVDPLLFDLPEQAVREAPFRWTWMTRLLDAAGAIAARGYGAAVETAVDLRVTDPLVAENDGAAVLTVVEGRGRLQPGGTGRVEVDVGALSALYTGYVNPWQLASMGRLRGADTADLEALATAFHGPPPWMRDYF